MNEEEETLLYTAIKEGCAQTVIDALAGVLSEFLVCVAYLEQGKSTPPPCSESRCVTTNTTS